MKALSLTIGTVIFMTGICLAGSGGQFKFSIATIALGACVLAVALEKK